MNNKRLIYIFLPILIALALVFGFFRKEVNLPINNIENESKLLTYTNDKFGFTFDYPDTYTVEERNLDTGNRYHTSIVLISKGFVPPDGGEGPTTINLDIYQNNLDNLSIERWIKETSASNYKLSSDGKLTSLTVDGEDALTYNWDGLYSGQTIVFEHDNNIYALSVTHMTPTDQILSDFEIVYDSFRFLKNLSQNKLPQTLVENYLKENISTISTEKEVLGGKFYITDLKLNNGSSGVVSYEDGHNAFVADFTYDISTEGNITINSFVIRK
jgi:hypothetical protein